MLPNILFILTDDQGCWALGAAGNTEIRTPNLDRLAASGIRFNNFFCVSPVCSPARASILTGLIPSSHGVHDWLRRGNLPAEHAAALGRHNFAGDDCAIQYLSGYRSYTQELAAQNYICGLSGKWHMGDSLTPQHGFSYWRAVPFGGSAYFNGPVIQGGQVSLHPGYLTDWITQGALDFLDQYGSGPQPFYLSIHYTAPHSPWDADQHPAELRDLYSDCPFDSVPDLPPHPWQMNSTPRGVGEKRRELLTGYYAAISGLDHGVGQILDWLEAHHLRENTLVIFSGDNGMNMGHHGVWGKGNGTFPANMYEESIKVPVILSQPGSVPEGVVNDDLLSHYDLSPTILEYALGDSMLLPNQPGQSFAPLLAGKPLTDPRSMVTLFTEYGPTRCIRTRRWKYVHRYPYGPHELYDLEEDPGETRNLAAEASPSTGTIATAAALKAELDAWFARYADPRMDGAREAVTGKGQLDRAGVMGEGRTAYADDWSYIDEHGQRRK